MLEKPPHSPIEAPVRAPSERTPSPKPDLMASLIVLFISAAINIFVFWISSQYLGKENFQRLPDWIIGTYRGVWSSVAVGGAGIGLAIVRAFTHRREPSPNYLFYIGVTSAAILLPVAVLIAIPFLAPQLRGHVMQVPSGASRIDGTGQPSAEFDLENSPNWAPVTYVSYILRGTYSVTANTVRGHLSDGRFTLAKEIPRNFPD